MEGHDTAEMEVAFSMAGTWMVWMVHTLPREPKCKLARDDTHHHCQRGGQIIHAIVDIDAIAFLGNVVHLHHSPPFHPMFQLSNVSVKICRSGRATE
jgi:hypothetical protein